MSSSPTGPELNPHSATRFRTRSLLITTVIVAVGAALCGAHLRGRSEVEQHHLIAIWGVGFAFFVVSMLVFVWQRYRAEKRVGTVRFRLPWFESRQTRLISPNVGGSFMLFFAVLFLIYWTRDSTSLAEQQGPIWRVAFLGCYPGLFFAFGVINFWWSEELWIGDQGLVWLRYFYPWKKVEKWSPHEKHSNVVVLNVPAGLLSRTVAVRVPESQFAPLLEFLQKNVGDPAAPGSDLSVTHK